MSGWPRRVRATLALTLSFVVLTATTPAPVTTPTPTQQSDGLSGTWRVTRVCLAICVTPPPALKVVRHVRGDIFMTGPPTPQVLYRMGAQVLVHGPKDSSLLAIESPGRLMSGRGVGNDGSSFTVTWRCVAAPAPAPAAGVRLTGLTATRPGRALAAMEGC